MSSNIEGVWGMERAFCTLKPTHYTHPYSSRLPNPNITLFQTLHPPTGHRSRLHPSLTCSLAEFAPSPVTLPYSVQPVSSSTGLHPASRDKQHIAQPSHQPASVPTSKDKGVCALRVRSHKYPTRGLQRPPLKYLAIVLPATLMHPFT